MFRLEIPDDAVFDSDFEADDKESDAVLDSGFEADNEKSDESAEKISKPPNIIPADISRYFTQIKLRNLPLRRRTV